ILVKVLAPGFYARQNIRTPVRIAIITLLATQVMNFIFIWPLAHAGLALAIGLGACLNAGLLYYQLRRHAIYTPQPGWAVFLFKLLLAVYAMAAVLWIAADAGTVWLAAGASARVMHLAWVITLGAATYFATLWLLGFRLRDFIKRV
ncbi:MAG: lipid II flippase MurJ, partial [Burkholderiales bacterium]|nr:lipid II flippase MurJ [Burkholderiales bacterium]